MDALPSPRDALPALRRGLLAPPDLRRLEPATRAQHPPRILLLYGSLRERSYSRLLVEEADRLLRVLGAETRIFDPRGLPMANSTGADHPKVQELRALALWSEGQVWCSPEMHGAVTGVFKNQIDWLPLEIGAVRPTQGRTLAVMQVSGGSQSFNAVNTLRLLGRWMRMFTIPNQSSVPKAYEPATKRDRNSFSTVLSKPASASGKRGDTSSRSGSGRHRPPSAPTHTDAASSLLSLAMMAAAGAVQTKGLGSVLWSARYRLMAAWSATRQWKLPRRMRWRVSFEKNVSTALSQEPEVGVKWKVQRGWRASQARTFGCLWVA